MWSPYRDSLEYTACEANLFRGEDSDGIIIAAGDNYGRISLLRYPCLSSLVANRKLYWASSGPITRLRFASGDGALISLGGQDKVRNAAVVVVVVAIVIAVAAVVASVGCFYYLYWYN